MTSRHKDANLPDETWHRQSGKCVGSYKRSPTIVSKFNERSSTSGLK